MTTLVLVADDDVDVARFIASTLDIEDFEVSIAHDGVEALRLADATPPALAILDVAMPGLDGLAVCRRLRAAPATAGLPVILLTGSSRPGDRVLGLEAGADDYLLKPFDSLELVARVRSTLRRNSEMRAVSPLTGLPGNHRIGEEIEVRVSAGHEFAVCHLDLDNFKAFNDRYGWVRGDEVISLVATALRSAAAEAGEPQPFVGHVGGDDFVAVCSPEQVEPFCRRVLSIFDTRVKGLHDAEDARQGYLRVVDRQGDERHVPLTSLSIGVAVSTRRQFSDPRAIVAVATEMKTVAKSRPGSTIAIDRRTGPADPAAADGAPPGSDAEGGTSTGSANGATMARNA
jgi:diguanylate cyclase (GGDEF)-like protein